MHPHRPTISRKHTRVSPCLAHTHGPTWLQHPNLQQVGSPLRQPRPGIVVIPPPQLCHTLVLARLRVTGPADAQADIVAGLRLLDGSPSSEGGGLVPPLNPSISCEGHQVMELNRAHWLEPPCYRHGDSGWVVGFDDALQVKGVAVGDPWCPGDSCDRKARFCRESRDMNQGQHLAFLGQYATNPGLVAKLAVRAEAGRFLSLLVTDKLLLWVLCWGPTQQFLRLHTKWAQAVPLNSPAPLLPSET